VQAPPQDGEELAGMIPGARFHLLEQMGHSSWYGHRHDDINALLHQLLEEAA
jgi:hypothetical protein